MLNEFGKMIRKFRIEIGLTMMQMAKDLNTTPAFLSAMETGRKRIPANWISTIKQYLEQHGASCEGLEAAADVANKTVSLDGLSREHQMLVAGFARVQSSAFNQDDVVAFKKLLQGIQGEGVKNK
jgi:transcriptional regulator with XRE-family HTH domain